MEFDTSNCSKVCASSQESPASRMPKPKKEIISAAVWTPPSVFRNFLLELAQSPVPCAIELLLEVLLEVLLARLLPHLSWLMLCPPGGVFSGSTCGLAQIFGLCEDVAVLSPLVLSWLLQQLTRIEQEARAALGARPKHEHGVRGVTFPNRVTGNGF